MTFSFRTLRGEPFELEFENPETVESIKCRLKDDFKFVPNNIHLIIDGYRLEDQDIINPAQLNENQFIVIHEKNPALRVDTEFIRITKTPLSVIDSATLLNSEEVNPVIQPQMPSAFNGKKKPIKDSKYEQSPQFQETMNFMKQILPQLPENECISALRKFHYDGDAAINFIQNDGVFEEEEVVEELPLPEPAPIAKPAPKLYDVSGLKSYQFGEFQAQVNSLTNKEQYDLLRILKETPNNDTYFLTQVFFSCDKDYITTKQCLH